MNSREQPRVVILAGGHGTRLAERTDEMPKPMVEVGGMPILWHILKIYSHFGFNDFLIACGYKAEVIKRFFLEYRDRACDLVIDYRRNTVHKLNGSIEPWRIALLDTGAETLTGGRLRRVADHLRASTFLMTYGDGVADIDLPRLIAFHRDHGRLATFTAVHPPPRFGLPQLAGDRVIAFEEKPDRGTEWINGGFFVLEPDVLDLLDGDATSFEAHTLPELARRAQLMAYRHDGFWHPMDTLRDVRSLNAMCASDSAPWRLWDRPSSPPDSRSHDAQPIGARTDEPPAHDRLPFSSPARSRATAAG
jgi:glucose-1-phosphate cytidylyltransferase